jgi:Na+/H+ antiporter NhaD/arsenite permease-like protein
VGPGWWARLRGDWLFWGLPALLAVLTALAPARVPDYPALVDGHTIAALAGLLVLTRGLEESGALHRLARALLRRVRTERGLALALVALAAGLSTVITNDVALFVVVPMTLGLRGGAGVPVARLVVFAALAVNAGSALTPIGNPQNLFLWGLSGASFLEFTVALAPIVAVMMAGLLALTVLAFPARPLTPPTEAPRGLDRRLLAVALALYAPLLLLVNAGRTGLALAVVGVAFVLAYRRVLAGVDWPLLAVFVLMFIDFRLLADLAPVRALLGGLPLGEAGALFLAGAGLSQAVSNVPAAIVLAEYTADWRTLAWGVNVGGIGLAVGSLANIIALRMLGQGRAWASFHAYAVPFLLASAAAGWAWLRWMG